MARKPSWRLGLRAYLAATLKDGVAPTVGELVDRFGDEIPLHHAARKWAMGRQERELPPAYRMRFYTLTQELHWLQCTFEPPGHKTYDTRVVVHGISCPLCGGLFVAEKRRAAHGRLCGGGRPVE
jgi:hypothetical protein